VADIRFQEVGPLVFPQSSDRVSSQLASNSNITIRARQAMTEMSSQWNEDPMLFRDRREAGRRLADHLLEYRGRPDVLVLGLPRGGVPVAFEVARALHASLDVLVVRKLGLPGHEELALGATAPAGFLALTQGAIEAWAGRWPLIGSA